MVTPEGVAAMFTAAERTDSASGELHMPVKVSSDPIIERDGFDRFKIKDKDRTKGAIVFERRGLGWTLVGLDLPSD